MIEAFVELTQPTTAGAGADAAKLHRVIVQLATAGVWTSLGQLLTMRQQIDGGAPDINYDVINWMPDAGRAAAATETLIAAKREDTKTTPPILAETPGVQYSVAAAAALAEKPKMSFAAMFENDRFGSDSE